MRFVFVTDELPRPGLAGHLALNHAIIAWLRDQGHAVTILLTGARMSWPAERYQPRGVTGPMIAQLGTFVVALSPRAQLGIFAKTMLAWLPAPAAQRLRRRRHGADAVLGSFIGKRQSAWCARYLHARAPDAVLIDTIFRAPVLAEPGMAKCHSIIITHDVFYRRHAVLSSAGYSVSPSSLTRADEAALLAPAGAIAAIQPEEAAELRALCPEQRVFVTPMPAMPRPRPERTARAAEALVFVGSASLPNIDGLRWFLESVWPILRRWRPAVSLDLVGDCGHALHRLPAGVNRLGRLARLGPTLHRASLAISPLRVGSGLKIKLLDYASHGLITIATPASLAGFAADPAAPFIAAATPAGFATAINRALSAGAKDGRALAYIAKHYSPDASFAGLRAALALPDDAIPREPVSSPFP